MKNYNVLVHKFLLLVFMFTMMSIAKSQQIVPPFESFKTNGIVDAIEVDEANDIVYIGGSFTRIGGIRNGAAVDPTTGDVPVGYPEPNGIVEVAIPDGNGGYYIGGRFTEVDGMPRSRLAHIDNSGNLTSWNPSPNADVYALELVGNTLYVGGNFTNILGESRFRLAAVDVTTGSLTSWTPLSTSFLTVYAIKEYNGSIYVGGQGPMVAFNATDASTEWSVTCSIVYDLEIENDVLFVGGTFGSIDGVTRSRLASVDLLTNTVTSWDPSPNRDVNAIAPNGSTVFIGGDFLTIGGVNKRRIAEVDVTTGAFTSFEPFGFTPPFNMEDLVLDGTTLYVGGRDLYAIDITTGNIISDAIVDGLSINTVRAIGIGTGDVYAGGGFNSIGGIERNGLAAISATNGQLTAFNPDVNGSVRDMILEGSTLYLAGNFTSIGATTRNGIAAINTSNGLLTSWNPDAQRLSSTGAVIRMIIDGPLMYVGGTFTQIGGQTRFLVAALDLATGAANSWNPNSDLGFVNALAMDGDILYVGGTFNDFGGERRARIAAVDKNTGVLSSWDPSAGGTSTPFVNALEVGSDGTVYAAGQFTSIGGQPRNRLAALDPTTGLATSWDPSPNSSLFSLDLTEGGILYVGGNFSIIDGQNRNRVASFNTADGSLQDWTPDPAGAVNSIVNVGFNTYLGGAFTEAAGVDNAGFAVVTRSPGPPVNLMLDNLSVDEAQALGATVGVFSVVDEPDTHTYELVAGAGSDDNALFSIDGSELQTAEILDFETNNSLSIRVRVTDGQGNTLEESFAITVNNVIETGNDFITFSAAGQVGPTVIDDSGLSNFVEIPMPLSTDFSAVDISFTVSSGAMSNITEGVKSFNKSLSGGFYVIPFTITSESGVAESWSVRLVTPVPAGTYRVESTADFEDLRFAINSIRTGGATGDIVLEVAENQTTSTFILSRFEGTDSYSLTIRPSADAGNIILEGSSSSSIFQINGVENLTIDGQDKMTIQNRSTGRIFSFSQSNGEDNKNVTLKNTSLLYSAGGIILSSGINILIEENVFRSKATTTENGSTAISVGSSSNTVSDITIRDNYITFGSDFNSPSGGLTGIIRGGFVNGTNTIFNNVIEFSPSAASLLRGISFNAAPNTDELIIAHNTIVTKGTNTSASVSVTALEGPGSNAPTSLTISNNIVDLRTTISSGSQMGMIFNENSASSVNVSGNNVSLNGAGGTQTYARINGTTYDNANFGTLQALISGTTNVDPTYSDITNSNYHLGGSSLNDADLRGLPVSGITSDFDGAIRSTNAPSKGAFETPNNITKILDLSLTELVGDATIVDGFSTISGEVSAGTGFSLNPSFTLFPGASINPNSGTTQDFSSQIVYTVTAEDGTTRDWAVTLTEQNGAPTNVSLSSININENAGNNANVGTILPTDPNTSDSFSYALVSGSGSTDNALFNIDENILRATNSLDHEVSDTRSVRMRITDSGGLFFERVFTINVVDVNDAPNNIFLSNSSVQENMPIGTLVGSLTSADQDAGDTHTYSLKVGTPDNAFFTIDGDQLLTGAIFDFETKSTYNLEIITNDGNGGQFEQEFTVSITDEASVITDISLSGNSLDESQGPGILIGTFSVQGADLSGAYTYSFVSGMGDEGNVGFNISDDDLVSFAAFNHEIFPTVSIRIQASGVGGTFSKAFTININDLVEPPTDIDLSNNSIQESLAVGTTVGILSTIDQDEGETYTYTLVSGTGDSGNGSFQIVGDDLRSSEVFDFETQTSYSVRIQTDDGNGNQYAEAFTINIGDVGPSITDIGLTNTQIDENNSTPLTVGTFSTLGEEVTGSYTYSLVAGDGDAANTSFFIVGDELRTSAVFDHEIISAFSIRVRTDDGMGSSFEKAIALTVNDVNEAPTELLLSANDIDENDAVNENIGTLSTVDEDAGSTHTYSFVSGTGDDDNGSFTISGNSLRAGESFDFETKSSYSVRIQTDDGDGGLFEETFTIVINDVSEAPTALAITGASVDENNSINEVIGSFITSDQDAGETYTYSLVSGQFDTDNSLFNISGDELRASQAFDFESQNNMLVRVRTDDGNGGIFERGFSIDVNDVNEVPTDLDLVGREINESTPIGTLIGILSTVDPDAGDTHTYSYTNGCTSCDPISDESAPFIIVGNELRSNIVFDFETASSYGIDVTTTDAGGLTRTEGKVIQVIDLPAQVTSLDLSNQSINENESTGALVGSFSTSGEDLSGNFTYSLVSGNGDDDNALFTISNDQLLTSESFDFETKNSLSIRVMTDDGVLTSEEIFTIAVENVFEAPTDLILSESSIAENNATNDVIGTLTTTDEDAGESFTYALVSGDGDTDNASFNINGNELRATGIFDFETKNSFSVRIETNDGNGGAYQKAFTISVSNVNESISLANPIADQSFEEGFGNATVDLTNVFVDTDGDDLTFTVSSSDESAVTASNSELTLTITEVGTGTATITVTADDGSGVTTSDEFEVVVTAAPLGLEDEVAIEVYPNPTTDFINISSDVSLEIRLIDLQGQILQIENGASVRMDLQEISSGTYLLKLTDGESTTTRRIIKAN